MTTENASYISEFNTSYPADGDAVGEGGGTTTGTGSTRGHLNMIKYALKTQFSGLSGTTAVTSSEAEMNLLAGKSVIGDAVLASDQSWSGSQRGTPQTITQGTLIDLDTGNNFLYTPAAADELSFANETTGQSGFIKLINPSAYVITLGSEVKAVSTFATDVTTAGTYLVTYFSDGTNVYVSASASLV